MEERGKGRKLELGEAVAVSYQLSAKQSSILWFVNSNQEISPSPFPPFSHSKKPLPNLRPFFRNNRLGGCYKPLFIKNSDVGRRKQEALACVARGLQRIF